MKCADCNKTATIIVVTLEHDDDRDPTTVGLCGEHTIPWVRQIALGLIREGLLEPLDPMKTHAQN